MENTCGVPGRVGARKFLTIFSQKWQPQRELISAIRDQFGCLGKILKLNISIKSNIGTKHKFLFLQSEGVTEVKTKGSPAARKGEVSTKLIQHHRAYKFDTFTRRIQRHVRIYSYKQVRVHIYVHIYIHTSQTSFSPEIRNNESNRRKP